MQGFILPDITATKKCKILIKSVDREIKVKGTESRCLLEECVKDSYYARFHPHS